MNLTAPYLTGTFEYLEKNLLMVRRQLRVAAKKTPSRTVKLYGSLPKLNLSFQNFKKMRHQISTSWEQEWS